MAETYLNKEQVNAVVEFAQALWAAEHQGYYSPLLQNSLLVGLNNDPKSPTFDKIKKSLADYKNSAENIHGYMEFMKRFDMLFARTLETYANILAFDLQVVCSDAFSSADFTSDEYIADKRRVYNFLNSFDYKAEFRRVVKQIMTTETGFYWFRRTKWGNKGMKNTLQLMPQRACLLTGYWEKGLLFDFDMAYFLNPGVDIYGFDPVFKKYYNNVFGEKDTYNYKPTAPFDARVGTYAMWTQTSPADGAWAKLNNPR